MSRLKNRAIITRNLACIAGAFCLMLLFAFAGGLRAHAAARTAQITSCLINGTQVEMAVNCSVVPASDDGFFYIYADEVYEDGPTGQVVAKVPAAASAGFSFPLNLNMPDSNLSRKFIVAVRQGGTMVQVSDEHYITNPEAVALHTQFRMDHGIKGLLPDPSRFDTGEIQDLGIQQVGYNIYLGDIVGESTDPRLNTIYYTYDGHTYAFNPVYMHGYDRIVRYFTDNGIQITMNILNNRTAAGADLIHPLSRDAHVCPGYAFNTADAQGTEHLKAIASFLARRYSGTMEMDWQQGVMQGQVDNWVVGNEVNARTEWYYMSSDNLDLNVNSYVKAFRVFYNGIKSENAFARVYNSIDQEWRRKSNPGCFLSSDYLELFNYHMLREGNIDWGLSMHPYNAPLYDPYAWCGYSALVNADYSTPYITMQNFHLITDLLALPEYLNPAGMVRSVILTEIGFTSSFGQEQQAASIVYGYLKAISNPYIDGFLLFRHTDDAHEMQSNLAEGLVTLSGEHKLGYDFYRAMGTPYQDEYFRRASQIIGQDIVPLALSRIVLTRGGWYD